ncbi:MAG: M20/M25/M40 family metallo-hydrolase [Erysipelotrichaceae bacterium]
MNIDRIKEQLINLCHVASVSGSYEETLMPQAIKQELLKINYFKQNPKDIYEYELKKGSYLFAFKKANKETKKTILLLSHFDVVDVEEYGIAQALAFDPIAYTAFLKSGKIKLDKEVEEDLNHNYLFGRGVCDMKWGISVDIELLHYFDEHPDQQTANLLLVSVPDEERNSEGMCAAAHQLCEFQNQHDLKIASCVVGEPDISFEKLEKGKRMFVGAAGKIMPLFYCVGKETHVGDPYFGLNPNLLTSKIVEKMELSPAFIDHDHGYDTPAPTCLRCCDLKGEYSVQTPYDAWCYFNLMTICKSPDELLKQIRELAHAAFEEVLKDRQLKYEAAKKVTDKDFPCNHFTSQVMSYRELYDKCKKIHGESFVNHMKKYCDELAVNDLRDMTLAIIQECNRFDNNRDPKIILAFAPPYYPHTGFIDENSELIQACKELSEEANQYEESFEINYCFNGLTDMSYLSLRESIDIDSLTLNFPLWGKHYQVPLKDIRELNIPFVNFGPLGKDPHKYTERIDEEYSFHKAPFLLLELVKKLSK